MSKETTYPIGDGAHHRRGQFVKSHPNSRCLSVSPVHQRRCALNTGHTGEHACNGAVWSVDLGDMFGFPNSEPSTAQVDPASFRHQRDQAQAAIRELLALYDAQAAEIATMTEDIHTLIIAVMYGDPPGGWNKERGAEFSAEIQAATGRQQDRRQVMQP